MRPAMNFLRPVDLEVVVNGLKLHVLDWGGTGYGPLDPPAIMRSAIPAVTMMITGVQAAAAALFAGALEFSFRSMNRRQANG